MKIAVSGLSGSGNSTVCRLVGKKMGLRVINYTFRDMAKDLGMEFERLHDIRKEDWSYDYLLDRKLLEMFGVQENAIMGSRLAIWIAPANLRIWLDADLGTRAKRIAKREGIMPARALALTRKRDAENARQYMLLYGLDIRKHAFADLAIDTNKMPAEKVAQRIVALARGKNFGKTRESSRALGIKSRIAAGLKKIRC
ncbi:MAG: (d)CMP kinase [Candidatus Micrarchaeota archaeon]